MSQRYFVETPISGESAVLEGAEAHHLIHVMRARAGQAVTLFDGSGREFSATIGRVARSEVELTVLSSVEVDRELPFELVLAVALPKGDRQKWLVEKAVELGVGRLIPLATSRGVAQGGEQAIGRLRRGVIEASKQCGRNRLMEIESPLGLEQLAGRFAQAACRLLAHPQAEGGDAAHGAPLVAAGGLAIAAIGPEGGFTDDEVALAEAAGWRRVDLGRRILRIETAAVFLAAMIVARSQSA